MKFGLVSGIFVYKRNLASRTVKGIVNAGKNSFGVSKPAHAS
jgi:hypothetical protein